jgi:diguanylate cyclase (GGDEF)-like protein/putative nucleotidyltransferase with HDIG domain
MNLIWIMRDYLIALISLAGLLVFGHGLYKVITEPPATEWLLLSLVAVLVISRVDVKMAGASPISDALIFTSALLYGAWPSAVLAGVNSALDSLIRPESRRAAHLKAASASLSIYLCGALVESFWGKIDHLNQLELLLATGLMAFLYYALNLALTEMLLMAKQGHGLAESLRGLLPWSALAWLAGTVITCLIVRLMAILSFQVFIIAAPMAAALYLAHSVYRSRAEDRQRYAEQVAELNLRVIDALAAMVESRGHLSKGHVQRVQIYAAELARLFGLPEEEIEALRTAAVLQDVGKLALPDYILDKPGPLTKAEFDIWKEHAVRGASMLERMGFSDSVVTIVRHHHEKWDGRGHPDGLRGDQIPIGARILAVADSFESALEDRSYHRAMSREEAIAMLKHESGRAFDPQVVRAFLDNLPGFEAQVRRRGLSRLKAAKRAPQPINIAVSGGRDFRREIIILYDIGKAIESKLELGDIFAVLSARLASMVGFTTCALYLTKDDSLDIEVAHASGREADKFRGRKIPLGEGVTGWVVANQRPLYNCDPRSELDAIGIEPYEPYQAVMSVPLLRGGRMLGALTLFSSDLKAYEPDHLKLAETAARLLSDAMLGSALRQQVDPSNLVDLLTGLANSRGLRHRFEEEADQARRHQDTFALMVMDLDNFRLVNDRFGIQVGDQLLREVALLLYGQLRSSDFICRYSADEFIALARSITPEEAHEVAQRLQQKVDSHACALGGSRLSIGMSIGWACFGIDGETLDELLLAATRAMYADKARRKAAASRSGSLLTSDLDHYRVM